MGYPIDPKERGYLEGQASTLVSLARYCLREMASHVASHMGRTEETALRWKVERAEIVSTLRRICTAHGDNDWPDDLHLMDVIEKHLLCHLEARAAKCHTVRLGEGRNGCSAVWSEPGIAGFVWCHKPKGHEGEHEGKDHNGTTRTCGRVFSEDT